MGYTLYNTTYRDANNNKIVFSDDVRLVEFYDASVESWDRTGAAIASWFLEPTLPNDAFYNSIDSDKWSANSQISGEYSIDVAEGVTFSISNASGKLYLDSSGLWSLTGDFSVVLGLPVFTFYDEYRSATSFGINISASSGFNVRVARVTNYGDTAAAYQALYTEGADPLFFGWTALSNVTDVSNPSTFTISRSGNTVSCFVGDQNLGEVSGVSWGEDVSVSIGLESKQSNSFTAKASFFSVAGELSVPSRFSSEVRGTTQAFPEKSIILTDSVGMSIVDHSDMSLWARFRLGSSNAFIDENCGVFAVNGKIYLSTSSGLYVIDFVEDAIFKYAGGSLLQSDGGIVTRNNEITFSSSQTVAPLASDSVEHVFAKTLNGHEYISATTTSGISLIVDQTKVVSNDEGFYPSKVSYISDSGKLYWAGYDYNNSGDLSYYSNVEHFITYSGTEFSRSGFYSKDTSPYRLSSSMIYDMHSVGYSGADQIVLASEDGVTVFFSPPQDGVYCKTYGVAISDNPVADPMFSSYLGSSPWLSFSSSWIFACTISTVDSWATGDSRSLELITGNGLDLYVPVGIFSGVMQTVDFSGVDRIYYDVKIIGVIEDYDSWFAGSQSLVFKIGDVVVASYSSVGRLEERVFISESIDVSSYVGEHPLYIGMVSDVELIVPYIPEEYFLVSNIRTHDSSADFVSLGGSIRSVDKVFLEFSSAAKKVHYVKSDGYGSVDLVHDSQDFFTSSLAIVGDTTINSGGFYED